VPSGVPAPTTAAFSPEGIRAAIRGRALVPQGMLDKALKKIDEKLDAKETKHFTFNGLVTETREVEAHGIQIAAAKLVAEMADVLSKGQMKPAPPVVKLVIDAKTGVMTIQIGDDVDEEQPPRRVASGISEADPQLMLNGISDVHPEYKEAEVLEVANETEEDEAQHIHVKRGVLPPEVREALFGGSSQ
jgi:hypothetical protein